ncbi:MAG: thioredoxin family protein [Marinilabiliales bacterium]|nr:thioredoxin family protein [Marinilabiliales bacterium]
MAAEYAGRINIYKVDIEKEKELAAVFGVQSIPTFLFCPLQGKPTISSGIANTPAATKTMFIQQIEELLLKEGNCPIGTVFCGLWKFSFNLKAGLLCLP